MIVWTPAVLSVLQVCVLYLHLFSAIEHVSHGKALKKYIHYHNYYYYYHHHHHYYYYYYYYDVWPVSPLATVGGGKLATLKDSATLKSGRSRV